MRTRGPRNDGRRGVMPSAVKRWVKYERELVKVVILFGVGLRRLVAVVGGDDVLGVLADVTVVAVVEWDPPSVGVGGLAD